MKIRLYYLLLLLVFPAELPAQASRVSLPGTEVRELHSDIIDQDFELFIKLPWSYGQRDTVYPVLFTTDANRTFPIYSTLSLIYETPGSGNEEIILVGIGYKTDPDRLKGLVEWVSLRNRDLRPERSVEMEQSWTERLAPFAGPDFRMRESGKAAEFMRFIREELIPFMEANYRISTTDRGLAGYSLGGLFSLYVLFEEPGTFTRYFAGSPSEEELWLGYEASYAARHDDLPARLVITSTEAERSREQSIRQLAESLELRDYPGLSLDTVCFAGEDHTSGGAAAISRGLRLLYYSE